MPTLTLTPAVNGHFQGWDSLVGAVEFAWQAVETSDGDDTYITVAGPPDPLTQRGRVSFIFAGPSSIKPTQVRVRATHKRQSGVASPALVSGFSTLYHWGGTETTPVVAVGAPFVSGANYVTSTTTFAMDPFSGSAWQAGALNGLEVYFQTVADALVKLVRLTRLDLLVDYDEPMYSEIRGFGAIVG